MTTVVVSAYRVASNPDVGGHFWVPFQYVHGLRQLGCEVFWLEQLTASKRRRRPAALATFLRRMERHGLSDHTILYDASESADGDDLEFMGIEPADAEAIFRRADLLLNFHYEIAPGLLERFRRTALVDIDPGLLQDWMSRGQLNVPPHDVYLTTGETVGMPEGPIPTCGVSWAHVRPPVCLDLWPYTYRPASRRFTTVSSWISNNYVFDEDGGLVENTKRVAFLRYADLASRTQSELELAAYFAGGADAADRALLERLGWHLRHSRDVAATPEAYRAYVQQSRGEISCAKPSCSRFRNAWVSDRTLCYLASGKPAVVQNTGPSSFLPDGDGMFRFSSLDEATAALAVIEASYERQCRAARELAAEFFDARLVLPELLALAGLGGADTGRPAATIVESTNTPKMCSDPSVPDLDRRRNQALFPGVSFRRPVL